MQPRGKQYILWTVLIAFGTFYLVHKVDALRNLAYGTPSTPPNKTGNLSKV